MQDQLTLERLSELRDTPVYDAGGDKIGKVEEIFYDEETQAPEWIGIGTGFLGTKRVLVPTQGADVRDGGVYVPFAKDQVKDSPDVDADEISVGTERELYSYYGIDASQQQSDSVLPEDGLMEAPVARGPVTTGEGSVTRSEEELQVGKRDVEVGRARLRKWVETEPVAVDVDLHKETARVTRERIDQPVSGVEIGEEEIEVPLHAEEPMVQKRTVAKERIGLEKDVQTERETVRDQVRKERVDVDGDGVGGDV